MSQQHFDVTIPQAALPSTSGIEKVCTKGRKSTLQKTPGLQAVMNEWIRANGSAYRTKFEMARALSGFVHTGCADGIPATSVCTRTIVNWLDGGVIGMEWMERCRQGPGLSTALQ
jgi:hypothetical protein